MSESPAIIENGIYHLYNHANGSENLCCEDEHYRIFLSSYRRYIEPIAYTFAYCILPNHFHFLVKIRDRRSIKRHFDFLVREGKVLSEQLLDLQGPDLGGLTQVFISHQFSNFFNSYTKTLNLAIERKGSLFQQNLRRKEVLDLNYLTTLVRYINLNPVIHGICAHPAEWDWSSYQEFLQDFCYLVDKEELFPYFGSKELFEQAHLYLFNGPSDQPDISSYTLE